MSPQKKELLQKILEALVPYWDMAEGFLLILQEEGNEKLKEDLYQEILQNIRNITSTTQQEKMRDAVQKLKEKSDKVTNMDKDEAEEMLDDFINNL